MKRSGSQIIIYGKTISGWKADAIVLAFLGTILGIGCNIGYKNGYQEGVEYSCSTRDV